MEYTPEQQKDILERITKASQVLNELQLAPSAYVTKIPMGNDVFADHVQPFLTDLKYKKDVESPKEGEKANVEAEKAPASGDNKA